MWKEPKKKSWEVSLIRWRWERIRTLQSVIKAFGGTIEDVIVVSKVIRTLLPIYSIKLSTIQKIRCDPNNKINLDALVGRLTTFELDNYDIYVTSCSNLESSFEAKLSLKKKAKKSKGKKSKDEEEDSLTMILKPLKHFLQGGIPKAKENTKVKFL